MQLIYQGPFDAVEIAALGDLLCTRGEPVEIPDEIAAQLLSQGGEITVDGEGKTTIKPPEHPNWAKAKTKNVGKESDH